MIEQNKRKQFINIHKVIQINLKDVNDCKVLTRVWLIE